MTKRPQRWVEKKKGFGALLRPGFGTSVLAMLSLSVAFSGLVGGLSNTVIRIYEFGGCGGDLTTFLGMLCQSVSVKVMGGEFPLFRHLDKKRIIV